MINVGGLIDLLIQLRNTIPCWQAGSGAAHLRKSTSIRGSCCPILHVRISRQQVEVASCMRATCRRERQESEASSEAAPAGSSLHAPATATPVNTKETSRSQSGLGAALLLAGQMKLLSCRRR